MHLTRRIVRQPWEPLELCRGPSRLMYETDDVVYRMLDKKYLRDMRMAHFSSRFFKCHIRMLKAEEGERGEATSKKQLWNGQN
jgi:hypothetical protein